MLSKNQCSDETINDDYKFDKNSPSPEIENPEQENREINIEVAEKSKRILTTVSEQNNETETGIVHKITSNMFLDQIKETDTSNEYDAFFKVPKHERNVNSMQFNIQKLRCKDEPKLPRNPSENPKTDFFEMSVSS